MRVQRTKCRFFGAAATFVAVAITPLSAMATASAATITTATPQSELSLIHSIKWTSNVTVTVHNGSWTFKSDGIPNSKFVAAYYAVPANPLNVSAAGAKIIKTSSILSNQHFNYTLPLTPVYSSTTTKANQGPIGITLNGGTLFNPFEGNGTTVATSDNFVVHKGAITASFIDSCDGHPGPGGQYHYHGLATCLALYATGAPVKVAAVNSTSGAVTPAVPETNAARRVPVALGVAFDGYGIYDNVAMNAKLVPVSSLDACNGIFSPVPGFAHGVYHYVLENVKGKRSSIDCYHGVVSSAFTRALQSALGLRLTAGTYPNRILAHRATAHTLRADHLELGYLFALIRAHRLDNC